MAITILQQPSLFQPVYNTAYANVSSNNVGQPNFRYVFDIFAGIGMTNTYLGRYKLLPRPNTQCLFSPNRVLESVFSYDLTQNITGGTISSGVCRSYNIQIGEEYGTNPVVFSGLSSYSGYCLNNVASYQLLPSWNYNNYWLNYYTTANTKNFLTNQPSSVLIRDNERASLSFLDYAGNKVPDTIRVVVYHNTGGTSTYQIQNFGVSGTNINTNTIVNHMGSGIWNLNNVDPSALLIGSQPIFNSNTDYKYEIDIEDSGSSSIVTKKQTYILDTRCTKYTPIRFMFLNQLGTFDYFTALLVSRQTYDITRSTYKKVLAYNYSIGDRGTTVNDLDVQESVLVTSDWVSNAESQWLKELFISKEVYELQDDGSILPIVIQNNSVEIKKSVNDKLINYDFTYTYAFKTATQRG